MSGYNDTKATDADWKRTLDKALETRTNLQSLMELAPSAAAEAPEDRMRVMQLLELTRDDLSTIITNIRIGRAMVAFREPK